MQNELKTFFQALRKHPISYFIAFLIVLLLGTSIRWQIKPTEKNVFSHQFELSSVPNSMLIEFRKLFIESVQSAGNHPIQSECQSSSTRPSIATSNCWVTFETQDPLDDNFSDNVHEFFKARRSALLMEKRKSLALINSTIGQEKFEELASRKEGINVFVYRSLERSLLGRERALQRNIEQFSRLSEKIEYIRQFIQTEPVVTQNNNIRTLLYIQEISTEQLRDLNIITDPDVLFGTLETITLNKREGVNFREQLTLSLLFGFSLSIVVLSLIVTFFIFMKHEHEP